MTTVQLPWGELAALTAALLWSGTSVFFTAAGRSSSPVAANTFKVTAATLLFSVVLLLRHGSPVPMQVAPMDWLWLVLSGLAGLTLGDSSLFLSFAAIGPRRGMLLMSLSPVLGALGGVFLLGERPGPWAWIGMAIAPSGVTAVLAEEARKAAPAHRGRRLRGALFGLGAAVGQASGALLAKPALAHTPTLPATWIRVAGAALFLLAGAAAGRRLRPWLRAVRARPVLWRLVVGSIGGPFLGIFCMLFALSRGHTGVVLTLMSTTPVWLLLLGTAAGDDRPTRTEWVGVFVAVGGVALLVIRGASG